MEMGQYVSPRELQFHLIYCIKYPENIFLLYPHSLTVIEVATTKQEKKAAIHTHFL